MAEYLDIYDAAGNRIGRAERSRCHGDPSLLHHTAHVVVIHPVTGEILLQKRAADKDIQPGRWDTAVGGHLAPGESYEEGAARELHEELGLRGDFLLTILFDARIRNEIESEDVRVFGLFHSGPFAFQKEEIDEVRFFSAGELENETFRKNCTPNLLAELEELKKLSGWYPPPEHKTTKQGV